MLFDLFSNHRMSRKLKNLEQKVFELEKQLNFFQSIINTNLIRIKNNQYISDQFIINMSPYLDISAYNAYELFLDDNAQYVIIDVESENYKRPVNFNSVIKIPLEDLEKSLDKIPSRTEPIYIISKDGIKSINACETLVKNNYYNCCNISGGYEKWPDLKVDGIGQTLK